jgi:uncharacterized protein YeaO (DUF488 family)
MKILLKRIYEKPDPSDGLRILVDRLWPRGLSKESAKVDVWIKNVAPSNELRRWYRHDVQNWPAFKQRYFSKLDNNVEVLNELISYVNKGKVVFLFGTKELQYNNAVALKEYLDAVLSR